MHEAANTQSASLREARSGDGSGVAASFRGREFPSPAARYLSGAIGRTERTCARRENVNDSP